MSNDTERVNLDRLAAQHAQAIIRRTREKKEDDPLSCEKKASAVDNMVTKALGVLQENGIYASALFLKSRRGDEERTLAEVVMDEILNLLDNLGKKLHFDWPDKSTLATVEDVLKYISEKVVANLERLLLAKETLEQMLIYARYGAKARGAEESSP